MIGSGALIRCVAFLVILTTGPACAQRDRDWPATTKADIVAAHQTLAENHPGAVPILGDSAFTDALSKAFEQALAAATEVRNEEQYRAVMVRFARAFDDQHIAFQSSFRQQLTSSPTGRQPAMFREPEIHFDRVNGELVIRLPTLDESARRAVGRLRADFPRGTKASRIVIDLRGNTGGDSAIGDTVIAQVFGEESLESLRADGAQCPVLWRATPDNAQWVQSIADRIRGSQPNRARGLDRVVQQMRTAFANRQPFSEAMPTACAKPETPRTSRTSPSRPDVIVVTDQGCFSSCLLFVERLRKLGARQTGETTSKGNWYMEVRSVSLPSGLGRFSTLQKVDLRRPKALGPFVPTQ